MLKKGDKAPNFKLEGSDGKTHSLANFKGKFLVLYFYPKDDTPGCTIEAKTFNKHKKEFESLDSVIVGVSKDGFESHCNFVEKYDLAFILLSDPSGDTIKAYGSFGDRGIFGQGTLRNTYIIGKDGKVLKVFEKVSVDKNPQQVLDFIKGQIK